MTKERQFEGLGVATGIAIGPAYVREPGGVDVPVHRVAKRQVAAEQKRLTAIKDELKNALKMLRLPLDPPGIYLDPNTMSYPSAILVTIALQVAGSSARSPIVNQLLYSCDSMAWSYAARREGRNQNSSDEAMRYVEQLDSMPVQSRMEVW